MADLSLINENLGVLTEAVEAKANSEKDSERTFIVSDVLTMIRRIMIYTFRNLPFYRKVTSV